MPEPVHHIGYRDGDKDGFVFTRCRKPKVNRKGYLLGAEEIDKVTCDNCLKIKPDIVLGDKVLEFDLLPHKRFGNVQFSPPAEIQFEPPNDLRIVMWVGGVFLIVFMCLFFTAGLFL